MQRGGLAKRSHSVSERWRPRLTPPEEEFTGFFRENRTQLVALAYLWCGDREEAIDLAQETLTRTWERWESVSRHPNPEAWARSVLHNLCTSRWRRGNENAQAH